LQFARTESEKRAALSPNAVARQAALHVETYAQSHGAWITLALAPELEGPCLRGSAVDIEQMLINLLRNAIESRPAETHVELATRLVGDSVCIEVSDDGPGIPAQHIHRLFEPFFTTRMAEGGTGLGLSVAHGIATAHGGSLQAASREGGGARFDVKLPYLAPDGR
jgi:signal transduction histidine kinase